MTDILLEEGNVVEEFALGNTKVKICDDFCQGLTPEKTQEVIDRIAVKVYPALVNQILKDEERKL